MSLGDTWEMRHQPERGCTGCKLGVQGRWRRGAQGCRHGARGRRRNARGRWQAAPPGVICVERPSDAQVGHVQVGTQSVHQLRCPSSATQANVVVDLVARCTVCDGRVRWPCARHVLGMCSACARHVLSMCSACACLVVVLTAAATGAVEQSRPHMARRAVRPRV